MADRVAVGTQLLYLEPFISSVVHPLVSQLRLVMLHFHELSKSNLLILILDETATDPADRLAGVVEIYERTDPTTGPTTFTLFQTLRPPDELGASPRTFLSLLLLFFISVQELTFIASLAGFGKSLAINKGVSIRFCF